MFIPIWLYLVALRRRAASDDSWGRGTDDGPRPGFPLTRFEELPAMKATPAPAKGDTCPQCGDEFMEARQLTPEEHAQLTDRDNPRHFAGFVDTAAPAFVAEHGTLAKCRQCGYQTRFAPSGENDTPANGDASKRDSATRTGARGRTS